MRRLFCIVLVPFLVVPPTSPQETSHKAVEKEAQRSNGQESWKIRPTGDRIVEVISPSVKYTIEATDLSNTVRVFKGEKQIEQTILQRTGDSFTLEATDQEGRYARLVMNATKEKIRTEVTIGKEKFPVESVASEHGLFLARELKKRDYPRTIYTQAFAARLRDDPEFRGEIKRDTRFATMLRAIPDGTIAACVAICAVCALEGVLACLWCGECIETI